jgi:antitoxin ParD1/3/4
MGTVQKTITLTELQDEWISAQIEAGRFANDSECIQDLIQQEQGRTAELESLRAALIEGEESGEPRSFDIDAFKQRMKKGHGRSPAG